jgi:hypothetical protein
MRRLIVSVTRSVSVAAVVVMLAVPVTYGKTFEKDQVPVFEKIVRKIKRVISVVMGDGISEPKPNDPPPAPTP